MAGALGSTIKAIAKVFHTGTIGLRRSSTGGRPLMLLDLGNRSAAVPIRADKTFPGAVGIGQVAVPGTEVVLTGVDAIALLEEVSGAAK